MRLECLVDRMHVITARAAKFGGVLEAIADDEFSYDW
jgi:hypothetical protein